MKEYKINFKKYQNKPNLKKSFKEITMKDGELFQIDKIHVLGAVLSLSDRTYDQNGNKNIFGTVDQAENALGLPYTDTSEWAGLWCCQGMAQTKTKPNLFFTCGAMTEDGKPVLIFEDKNENYFYFVGNEFSNLIDEQKERERAEQVATDAKNANLLVLDIVNIIKEYNGKQYGTRTAQAIYERINEASKPYKMNASLNIHRKLFGGGAWCYIEINGHKLFSYSYDFINDNNTIETPESVANMAEEFNGAEVFAKREKLKKQIAEQSKTLLPLLEEFNEYSIKLNKPVKDTNPHNTQVYTIGTYGFTISD